MSQKERNKKYYESHKDTANKRSKDWYENNKEKAKSLARKNYAENKERVKLSAKSGSRANKDKVQAANKRWAENNPDKFAEIVRRQGLRRSTGGAWTLEQYNDAFLQQEERCAICGNKSERNLDADHDHAKNTRRGLLCNACNMMLGYAKDIPSILESAAAYLRKWGKT